MPYLDCLICSPRKKESSPIIDISNSPCIAFTNSSHNLSLEELKIMSSTYIWTKITTESDFLMKRVLSIFPLSYWWDKRKQLNLSYHCLGAYLRPYKAFFNLYTRLGCRWSSNRGGCDTQISSFTIPFRKALFTSIWNNLNPFIQQNASKWCKPSQQGDTQGC